jgi:hypothetical protein
MSVKILQRFHITNGIGVEDGHRSMGERERRVDDDEVTMPAWQRLAALVANGGRVEVVGDG